MVWLPFGKWHVHVVEGGVSLSMMMGVCAILSITMVCLGDRMCEEWQVSLITCIHWHSCLCSSTLPTQFYCLSEVPTLGHQWHIKSRASEEGFACRDSRCLLFVHLARSHSWLKHTLKGHIKLFQTQTCCCWGHHARTTDPCLDSGLVCNHSSTIFGDQRQTHPEPWLCEQGGTRCCPPSPCPKWGFPMPYSLLIPLTPLPYVLTLYAAVCFSDSWPISPPRRSWNNQISLCRFCYGKVYWGMSHWSVLFATISRGLNTYSFSLALAAHGCQDTLLIMTLHLIDTIWQHNFSRWNCSFDNTLIAIAG